MSVTLDKDELKAIYDAYRTAYLNEKYYARRLTTYRRWNDTYEAALAIGASGTIGSWSVWTTTEAGGRVWAVFGGVVALLVVLKPFLQLAQKAERSSKLYIGYKGLRFDLENLVEDIKLGDFVVTQEIKVLFTTAKRRYQTLALDDEIQPVQKLLDECQTRVNEEVLTFAAWCSLPNSSREIAAAED
jgi:hypothetical protein